MLRGLVISFFFIVPVVSFAFSEPTECLKDTKRTLVNLPVEQGVKLCAGTKNAKVTIDCYKEAVRSSALNLNVETAIELCAKK